MPFIAGYHNSPLLMILFQNMILSLDNNASRIKVDSYLLTALTRVYAGTRCTVHTSGVHLYAQEFKPAELSGPALIRHPIKCVCKGDAQPTDIDVTVICTRVRLRSYLLFTTHLRGAILALGVAQRGAYAR